MFPARRSPYDSNLATGLARKWASRVLDAPRRLGCDIDNLYFPRLEAFMTDNSKERRGLKKRLLKRFPGLATYDAKTNTWGTHDLVEHIVSEVYQAKQAGAQEEHKRLVQVVKKWRQTHFPDDEQSWHIQNLLGDFLPDGEEIEQIRESLYHKPLTSTKEERDSPNEPSRQT